MKHLIIIAKYFYPLKNARSIQSTLFVKSLCENYKVTIITSSLNDNEELKFKNLNVVRVAYKVLEQSYTNNLYRRLYKKISKELGVTFLSGWSKEVTIVLEGMLANGDNFDVMTMSEPFDSHLPALYLKEKYNFHWHCFYSDPWPHSIMPKPYSNSALPVISWIQERVSKKVLEKADSLLFTNTKVSDYLEKKLNVKINDKAKVLRHLSVKIDSQNLIKPESKYFIHIGHLSKERVSDNFFHALVENIKYSDMEKIMLVGRVCPEMINLIAKNKWTEFFDLTGEVTQSEALLLALNSAALIVIEAKMNNSPFVPSKLAEYFHLNVPIICLTNVNSDAADLINNVGNGIVLDHNMNRNEMVSFVNETQNIILDEKTYNKAKLVFSSEMLLKTIGEII